MQFKTSSSPFLKPPNSIRKVMLHVLVALVPALIAYVWYFGFGIIVNCLIAITTALACEALMLKLQKKDIVSFLSDYSAILAAILLAFALPSQFPWYGTMLGSAFAIIVAKHLYGGLGYNLFNPAMAGYVVLLICFPKAMTVWPVPQHLGLDLDGLTSATPLDILKTDLGGMQTMQEILLHPIFGSMGAHGWEWINNWIAVGGIYLLFMKVIRWHIPVAVLAGLLVTAGIFNLYDPSHFAKPSFHLFSGAAMLGAFFIATDPVTAATSNKGRIIYGLGIGVLIYVIRTWGGYPDGVAFAVLLMNMCVPLIDYYCKPRPYGHQKKRQ